MKYEDFVKDNILTDVWYVTHKTDLDNKIFICFKFIMPKDDVKFGLAHYCDEIVICALCITEFGKSYTRLNNTMCNKLFDNNTLQLAYSKFDKRLKQNFLKYIKQFPKLDFIGELTY